MSFPGDNYVVPGAAPGGVGPTGAQGPIGGQGAAATVAVGAVTTLAPGTPATVVNVGTPYEALFEFGVPQGFQGDAGPTGPAADASTWSQYAATQIVDFGSYDIQNIATVTATIVSVSQIQDINGSYGFTGQFIGSDGNSNIEWKTLSAGPTGPTGPAGSGFDIEGLQNKLGIFPALPYTSDTTELAANNTSPATAIVPDATAPTSSTTPLGTPCWLYTKPVSNAGFNWYMYNPRFGNPTAPLAIRKYDTTGKQRVQSVWALVQPAVNTNIYTAGVIALNLYSYSDANPPTSGFYNTRWAYSNSQGINSGLSGTNLYAGFTYLLYAYDAPRITNQTSVGVPDVQDWGLRDPYDIYPDVNHIPLQNCVLAFNPWTDGTYYRTWDQSTSFLIGQTCIYSAFGTTANGIFYTAVSNNNNQQPVSNTGVPNLTHWVPLSPQPSTYATHQILSMNVNGISGTTTGWTAGPLLRVLSMGYTTGTTATTRTNSVRIVLN